MNSSFRGGEEWRSRDHDDAGTIFKNIAGRDEVSFFLNLVPTIPALRLVHVPAPFSFKYSIGRCRLSMMIRTAALLALPLLLHLIEATAAALPSSSHLSQRLSGKGGWEKTKEGYLKKLT